MQQFPFIDILIDLFESALHVSGDKLAHLQGHVLTVYTVLVQCTDIVTGRQLYRCIVPKLYIQSKSVREDGRVCRPKHVELIK